MSKMNVFTVGSEPVASFAGAELQRYLKRISGMDVNVETRDIYRENEPGIWLGVWETFTGAVPSPGSEHGLDDAIYLKSVGEDCLLLSGANGRSVLFAVYAYLESLGCRFVRMGKDGEVLPEGVEAVLAGYDVTETPSYRYRGVCIEGSLSIEHAVDLVDYMVKKRFNTYFIQFQNAYVFWSRWYDRHGESASLSVEKAEQYTATLVEEIKKRGFALQMVGHGWTNESLGVQGRGWFQTNDNLRPEKRKLLAQVNGKREWWGGVPINTELCLSNPEAFNGLADYIVQYAKGNPDIDFLHVWMSDGKNNRCECPGCSKRLPSEWYTDLLNAIDDRMEDEGITTRVVFLLYYDLLWAPEQVKLNNPDRFILMFAPITRTYRNALSEQPHFQEEPQPYRLNKNQFPQSTAIFVHYLKEWQKVFSGDGFTFDYHFFWMHAVMEPTGLFISKILHQDILGTDKIGLQGIVNCQVQRYFFPTGLAMEVSGRTMWDKRLSFEDIKKEYFSAAFGSGGAEVQRRLEKLSDLLDDEALFDLELRPKITYRDDLEEAERLLADSFRFIDQQLGKGTNSNSAVLASFRYLWMGLEFIQRLLPGFKGFAIGNLGALSKAYREAAAYLLAHEDEIERVCDGRMWAQWLERDAARAERLKSGDPEGNVAQ